MPCPYLHRMARSARYPVRLSTCLSPCCDGGSFLPSLGELKNYCHNQVGYHYCPLFAEADRLYDHEWKSLAQLWPPGPVFRIVLEEPTRGEPGGAAA